MEDNMIINIQDPQKGTVPYDLNEGMEFSTFQSTLKENGHNLIKIADIVKDPEKMPGYTYARTPNADNDWSKVEQWAYTIVVEGRIAKIGMTEKTLASRFSSYQAGTRKNRNKGTCSVTNFYCSEFIRECLTKGWKIELYAYSVPKQRFEIDVMGSTTEVVGKYAYVFEDAFLREHKNTHGTLPPLCRNSSLT